ncbi:MAG TPA: DUF4388 domain-containing protein [Syntrophobacteraceae bacterium]|nr:DUF4388 domain-containing protein [Syntrophobacteraceae bacterium]
MDKTGGRFSGTIEYVRLIDLVQVSCLAKMSHIIKVDSLNVADGTGSFYLDSGNVVHAELGDKIGEEAFFEILQWERGRFETLPLPENFPATINRNWEYLLIQAVRMQAGKDGSEDGGPTTQSLSRGFRGSINDVGLTDIVQLICLDSIDRIVEIRSETLAGTIHVRGGQVCHAQTGDLAGQEAFFKMLAAASGSFEILSRSMKCEVTIQAAWEHLLIEGVRLLDEASGVVEEQDKLRAESLFQKVQKKNVAQKIRLAMTGDKETRGLLIRDGNRIIQLAVVSNPRISESEVAAIAYSRQVDEEVLRRIAADKEWVALYPVRLALAANPRTPPAISKKLASTLNRRDLRNLSVSKAVPALVANEARRLLGKQPG